MAYYTLNILTLHILPADHVTSATRGKALARRDYRNIADSFDEIEE